MKNRRLLLTLLTAAAACLPAVAQNGFNMPFSQFGIGLNERYLPAFAGMGGTAFTRGGTNYLNPYNPASFAAVQTESFVFDFGMNIQSSVLRRNADRLSDADGNVGYLMVAFPLFKWWKTSVGLMPYSTVNYESVQTAPDPLTGDDVKTLFSGDGGVSQFYWGNGFNIGKRLALGFSLNYLYGKITRAVSYDFVYSDSLFTQDSRRQKTSSVSNLLIDLGAQYRQPIGERYTLAFGLTMRLPRPSMRLKEQSLIYTYYAQGTSEYLCDTVFPQPGEDGKYVSTLSQPLKVGLGVALERNNRWEVDLDGSYAPYSGIGYEENPDCRVFGGNSVVRAANWRGALGGEWKGDVDAASYWGRIGVRAGLFYERARLALEIDNATTLFNERGLGMGLVFPMRRGRSALTLSFTYSCLGRRDLLRRDLFTVGIALGSNEHWFAKRKYN